MLLTELGALIEQQNGVRYVFDEDVLVSYVNVIQNLAYSKNFGSFLDWDTYLTVWTQLSVTNIFANVSTDIGKTVHNAGSTAIGILKYYNASKGVWAVEVTTGTFTEADVLSIDSGTGTGTVTSTAIFRGPYYPEGDLECRLLVGITTYSDDDIFNAPSRGGRNTIDDDYGMNVSSNSRDNDTSNIYVSGRLNIRDNTFTFPSDPIETENYYRFVYYVSAPTITSMSDDENFVIPEESKYTLVYNGVIALANNALYGDGTVTPMMTLRPFLEEFWDGMEDQTNGHGLDSNYSQGA